MEFRNGIIIIMIRIITYIGNKYVPDFMLGGKYVGEGY